MARTMSAFAAIVATSVGCAADDTASSVIVRDSAGITIVESGATPAGEHGWVVSHSPLVRIGTVTGAEEYQFFRASDGAILTDGTIVVVNGGTHELRFYDAAGRFRHAAGGQGDGPGEMRSPSRVFRLPGDSLMVVELRRLSWFGPDGVFLRSMPLTVIRPAVGFTDGSFAGTRFAPA